MLELIFNGIEEQGDSCPISKWERDFMADMKDRYNEWGDRMRVSYKQWAIVHRIYDKVIGSE